MVLMAVSHVQLRARHAHVSVVAFQLLFFVSHRAVEIDSQIPGQMQPNDPSFY